MKFWNEALKQAKPKQELIEYAKSRLIYDKKVNGIISLNPKLKEEVENLNQNSKFKGIPIAVKDSLSTKDWVTSSGSKTHLNHIPKFDAELVERMKKNGAIIFAKTNMPKFGLDIQTISEIHGITNNPYDISLTSSGSSGGSASKLNFHSFLASVALGIVPIALGTDLSGSLRLPASFCGVYSIRPSIGRISLHGGVPNVNFEEGCEILLSYGAIAQNIEFLQVFMETACDNYKRKKLTNAIKVAITKEFQEFPTDDRIIEMNQKVIDILKSNHIECDEITPKFNLSDIRSSYDFITLNNNSNDPKYKDALEKMNKARKVIDNVLESYDIWILPCSAVLPYPHNEKKQPIQIKNSKYREIKYWRSMAYTTTVSLLGNPVLTLPVGMINHLPIGVQVVGKRNDDESLLAVGNILENVFSKYVSPPDFKLLSKL